MQGARLCGTMPADVKTIHLRTDLPATEEHEHRHIYILHTYIYTYIHTYIQADRHVYVHTYIHTYIDIHTYIHILTKLAYTYITHTHRCICTLCVCACVPMCVFCLRTCAVVQSHAHKKVGHFMGKLRCGLVFSVMHLSAYLAYCFPPIPCLLLHACRPSYVVALRILNVVDSLAARA